MAKCNLRIQRNPVYAGEIYDLRLWDGREFYPLGSRNLDELSRTLQEMTILDGSSPEQVCETAHKSGSANVQVEWPRKAWQV